MVVIYITYTASVRHCQLAQLKMYTIVWRYRKSATSNNLSRGRDTCTVGAPQWLLRTFDILKCYSRTKVIIIEFNEQNEQITRKYMEAERWHYSDRLDDENSRPIKASRHYCSVPRRKDDSWALSTTAFRLSIQRQGNCDAR